jgi:NAD(P)-dependent dehydrogenase (short-subunit alcohol dehydrogenase family)
LIGLAHSYAAMLAKEGITSNMIAPALIETDMIKGNRAIKPTLIPIGRFGTVDEVSRSPSCWPATATSPARPSTSTAAGI